MKPKPNRQDTMTKDVVMYHRGATVIDLIPEVERRLWNPFPPH